MGVSSSDSSSSPHYASPPTISHVTVCMVRTHMRRGSLSSAGEPDTSATRHFGVTKLVPKFKTNHRWSCVSSELSWVEVSRLFFEHGISCRSVSYHVLGVDVSQSVLMQKCPVTVGCRPVYAFVVERSVLIDP